MVLQSCIRQQSTLLRRTGIYKGFEDLIAVAVGRLPMQQTEPYRSVLTVVGVPRHT